MSTTSGTAGSREVGSTHGSGGFSLIETMIGLAILLVVLAGLFPPFLMSIAMTETQGNIATRATELSQDKMEALMALSFADPGLGGAMGVNSTVGAVPPAVAVAGYVDYLDQTGGPTTAAAKFYSRQWSISTGATTTLKTITVVVTAPKQASPIGIAPSTTLVCIKSSGL